MMLPQTMHAIGAPCARPTSDPAFLVPFETAVPEPAAHELLVEIMACAVNPVDTKVRRSLGEASLPEPRILGWDAAGIVRACGADVHGFAPGDEVFYAGALGQPGCNAEFHCVDARLVARKPRTWNHVEAAAVPLVALTAWELLFDRMGIDLHGANRGEALLVINGAGGVGSALIPLAKHAGLRVIATASRPETTAWCEQLGADAVIDHHEFLRPQCEALGFSEFPWIANLHDPVASWSEMGHLLAPFGTVGLIVEPSAPLPLGDPFKAKCARIAWEFMAARTRYPNAQPEKLGEILTMIAQLCEIGIFPKLDRRVYAGLTVEHLRACHIEMEQSRAVGKWVIDLKRNEA